jgi:hypothetical protein
MIYMLTMGCRARAGLVVGSALLAAGPSAMLSAPTVLTIADASAAWYEPTAAYWYEPTIVFGSPQVPDYLAPSTQD